MTANGVWTIYVERINAVVKQQQPKGGGEGNIELPKPATLLLRLRPKLVLRSFLSSLYYMKNMKDKRAEQLNCWWGTTPRRLVLRQVCQPFKPKRTPLSPSCTVFLPPPPHRTNLIEYSVSSYCASVFSLSLTLSFFTFLFLLV